MTTNNLEVKLKKARRELETCTDYDRIDELERLIASYQREIAEAAIHEKQVGRVREINGHLTTEEMEEE